MDHLLAIEDSQIVVEGSFDLVILDGWHGRAGAEILCKTGAHPWTEGYLCMHLIISREVADTKQAEIF